VQLVEGEHRLVGDWAGLEVGRLSERLNREIRRRTDDGRRYLGLDVLSRSRLALISNTNQEDTTTGAISA